MVKKKAPFIPITIIVIGIGVIFGMNARSHPLDPEELQKQAAQQGAENRPKETKEDLSSAVKNSLSKTAKMKPDGKAPLMAKGPDSKGLGSNPMLAPTQVKYHPTPNASSTDGQWYVPQSK